MYQKKNRKREIARRTLVYTTMVTTLVVALCTLLFLMLGYRFNTTTKSVEQAGLVQYNSFPRGAMVSIDSGNLDVTPTKNMVMPGQHQFTMRLKGYESWQKSVTIRSDTVTQLDYARLVPTEKRVTTVRDVTGIETAEFSPGGKYVIGVGSSTEGQLIILWGDVRSVDAPRFTEQLLNTAMLTGYDNTIPYIQQRDSHSFSIHAWDGSGRFVLIKHTYSLNNESMRTQWIRLDRENPKELLDVSAIIGFATQDMRFIGTGGDALYVLQDTGDVRRVRLGDSMISRPLLTGVTEFSLYDTDTIAFVASNGDRKDVGIWRDSWSEAQIIRTVAEEDRNQTMHIAASEYFSKDTLVVSVGDTATIYRGTLPGSDAALETFLQTGKKMTLGRSITALSISSNGRFIVLRDAAGFMSYDLERLSLSTEIALRGETGIDWLDAFHIWHIDETGQLLMQEFDGANPHKLLSAAANYDATLSEDGKYLYTFSKKDDVMQLQRLAMTIQK